MKEPKHIDFLWENKLIRMPAPEFYAALESDCNCNWCIDCIAKEFNRPVTGEKS